MGKILRDRRRIHVARNAVDTDAGRNAHHGGDRLTVVHDVDLFAEQQPSIEVVHVDGDPAKASTRWRCTVLVGLAAEVLRDTLSDGIELLPCSGPTVDRGAGQDSGLERVAV